MVPIVDGCFIPIRIPEKHFRVLNLAIQTAYRVLYGGRNGYKDWLMAQVIVERSVIQPTRVCFSREVMETLADSDWQLIVDTINRMGYNSLFTVTKTEIYGKNGSKFVFKGLRDFNADNIKSIEGIDIFKIGEAQYLTERSFNIVDPTIRKQGSEIWIAFNTGSETDFVYERFVKNPPDDALVQLVNYLDGDPSWLNPKIRKQADRMKIENPLLYRNQWLGEPSQLGRFFAELGPHNDVDPHGLPDDCADRMWLSLDHGIAHDTSAGIWYMYPDGYMVRLCSYLANGGTAEAHAIAIWDMIESFPYSAGRFPIEVYFDPSMATTEKLSDRMYRSVIDEYRDVFAAKTASKGTRFIPANNRKVDGCQIMRAALSGLDGRPLVTVFKGYNNKSINAVKAVLTDENNTEIYAKQDGDDAADEMRYGIVAGVTKSRALLKRKSQINNGEFILNPPRADCSLHYYAA